MIRIIILYRINDYTIGEDYCKLYKENQFCITY